jgi:hypothetical protein
MELTKALEARLLTPIILTTAFVIFRAWRSPVRDAAEADVVDEDE